MVQFLSHVVLQATLARYFCFYDHLFLITLLFNIYNIYTSLWEGFLKKLYNFTNIHKRRLTFIKYFPGAESPSALHALFQLIFTKIPVR